MHLSSYTSSNNRAVSFYLSTFATKDVCALAAEMHVMCSVYVYGIAKLIYDDKSQTTYWFVLNCFERWQNNHMVFTCYVFVYVCTMYIEHMLNRAKCIFFLHSQMSKEHASEWLARLVQCVVLCIRCFSFVYLAFLVWEWNEYIRSNNHS